ncbi:MAG: chemotaxis protein CheA, partial [Candidatus Marinimicrobia bacterium]|nr:chemotaxis protein CheA [Candidatus Neomarinimicrobiota bacterium]
KQDVKAVESAGDTEEKEKVIKTLKEKFENSSNPLEGDLELLGDFILETSEHLENADAHLMILEGDPQNDESLNTVFRAFHTVKGVAGFLDLTMVGTLAHEAENLLDKARKGEMRFVGPVCEITFQSLDRLKFLVIALQKSMSTNVYIPYDEVVPEIIYNLRQIIAGKTEGLDLDDSDQMPVARQQFPDGDTSDVAVVKSGGQRNVKIKEFVKVDSHRLDKLVNTIGEMVIVETMVSQLIEENAIKDKDDGQISARLNQMNKITRELQEMGTSLRMVPVKPVFQKMARLVRDLSKKMKRPVNFVMVGEDTELDKTVVDMIGDPLVHLVRNSMDHGIEATFEERRALDKPDIGRIELRSFNAGGNIYIEIEDDGKGLDKDAILAKAIKQGLVKENEKISDRDLYNLIFEAGFSTAKKVTDVSGRGVGMDVVRKNIAVLRGRVEISSEKGKGSVISIVLPLTLAIIEGMIIAVGEEKYIIPTLSIITSLRPEKENLNTIMDKGEMLNLKGELIPIFRLENIFNANAAIKDPTKGLIVVVEHDGKKLGLLTDKLLGQSQIVIKSLGESMHGIDGLSGGAILPDGRVGLILDIGGIMKIALSNSKKKKAVAEN